jgi:hypothetical protein
MLSIKLNIYDKPCQATSGGVSRLWIFDRDDFDFTQAAADANGNLPPYTAIARRTAAGATAEGGANLYPVKFQYKECSYTYNQTLANGTSTKYDHNLEFLLADVSHFITNWNERVDAASACNGIGVIIELNSGGTNGSRILVLSEKYVNGSSIREWRMQQNGSSGTTGKLFEDVNGQTTKLVGDYFRGAYEFTGGAAALEALEADDES